MNVLEQLRQDLARGRRPRRMEIHSRRSFHINVDDAIYVRIKALGERYHIPPGTLSGMLLSTAILEYDRLESEAAGLATGEAALAQVERAGRTVDAVFAAMARHGVIPGKED